MPGDDGMGEPQQAAANAINAALTNAAAATLDAALLWDVEQRLFALSDLVARRCSCKARSRYARAG